MEFLQPDLLYLLFIIPMAVAVYIALLRRRKKQALRYASLSIVKDAMGQGNRLRRHIPPLLFLVALTLMIAAVARPAAEMTLPYQQQTVVLAIDVSLSMQAEDVAPTRIAAAKEAARSFAQEQPRNVRIGVVSYAATAAPVQTPSANRSEVLAAIDQLQLQPGTAIGSGILSALQMLFPDAQLNALSSGWQANRKQGMALNDGTKSQNGTTPAPVAPGSHDSAAIVLLTDGQSTTGPDAVEMARLAADRGVRVYTLGIGTPDGQIMTSSGWSMRVRLDEDTLKEIARLTRAEYFYADNASDLAEVYKKLAYRLALEKKEVEIAPLFAAAAAFFSLLSGLLSMLWFHRIL